jgi:hypothetical protein
MPLKLRGEMEVFTRAINYVSRRQGRGPGRTYKSNTSCDEQAEGRHTVYGSGACGVGDRTAGSSWSSDDTTRSVSQYPLQFIKHKFSGSGTHVEAIVELTTPAMVEEDEEDAQA